MTCVEGQSPAGAGRGPIPWFHFGKRGAKANSRLQGSHLPDGSADHPQRTGAFLGVCGYCRMWVSKNGLISKLLYEALQGVGKTTKAIEWTKECERAFQTLKRNLMEASAFALLDPSKPYDLFIHEQNGTTLGVLIQNLGIWRQPAGFFSRQLGPVTKR